MADAQFAGGFYYREPNKGAPSFIEGRIVIKVDDFAKWFEKWASENKDEAWLSFDLKQSREGKRYAQINNYKKVGMTERPGAPKEPTDDINPDDIPF